MLPALCGQTRPGSALHSASSDRPCASDRAGTHRRRMLPRTTHPPGRPDLSTNRADQRPDKASHAFCLPARHRRCLRPRVPAVFIPCPAGTFSPRPRAVSRPIPILRLIPTVSPQGVSYVCYQSSYPPLRPCHRQRQNQITSPPPGLSGPRARAELRPAGPAYPGPARPAASAPRGLQCRQVSMPPI